MQPPSFDFGSLFPGQMMPPPVPSNNLVPRPSVQEVVEQRSPPKKQTADTGGDDRLSDIISDVGSIPSDLDLDDAEDIQKDIQKVTVPEPKKKRGAKKNVVVI